MKNAILTFALITTFGAFMFASNSANDVTNSTTIVCEGEHKCDDKCKKNKDGKCAEATANKGEDKGKASCCAKDSKKSCHGKKGKSKKKETEQTDPKS